VANRVRGATVFHPDLRILGRVLPSRAFGPRTLPLMRRLTRATPAGSAPVERVSVSATVRLFRPRTTAMTPALLWIHGGGLVMGTARQDDGVCEQISRELGIMVASVDYRLAPEHRFPAALEDCHDALDWLAAQPGVDADRIAIGGRSAGAGLAAAVALLCRERKTVAPAFQLLAYPMLDDRTASRPDPTPGPRRLWDNTANHLGWSAYLGRAPGGPDVTPLGAPARSQDLRALPATWIGVGTLDLFYDENVDYANRLRAAGVPCTLDVVEGAFHGFDAVGRATVGREFIQRQVDALRAALLG
jgi:acetyl esterase/lipase